MKKKQGFTPQPDHSRARRRRKNSLPCLCGARALQWYCQRCSCRVLVFPQWTEADVSRDTCSGSASSCTACWPGCRGSPPCPKIHPSLSPLACYCLKHSHGFMNSLRHLCTFLICCMTITCCEWREWKRFTHNHSVMFGAKIWLLSLWWKDLN